MFEESLQEKNIKANINKQTKKNLKKKTEIILKTE